MENPFRLSVFMMACLPWLALLLLTTCWRCSLATSDDESEDFLFVTWPLLFYLFLDGCAGFLVG